MLFQDDPFKGRYHTDLRLAARLIIHKAVKLGFLTTEVSLLWRGGTASHFSSSVFWGTIPPIFICLLEHLRRPGREGTTAHSRPWPEGWSISELVKEGGGRGGPPIPLLPSPPALPVTQN